MTRYTCKRCKAPVRVTERGTERTCEHADAPIVAWLTAVAKGKGSADGV